MHVPFLSLSARWVFLSLSFLSLRLVCCCDVPWEETVVGVDMLYRVALPQGVLEYLSVALAVHYPLPFYS